MSLALAAHNMAIEIFQSLFDASAQCVTKLRPVGQHALLNSVLKLPKCKPCVAPVGFPCCNYCMKFAPPGSGHAQHTTSPGDCQSYSYNGITFPVTISRSIPHDPGLGNLPGYFCYWTMENISINWESPSSTALFIIGISTTMITLKIQFSDGMVAPFYDGPWTLDANCTAVSGIIRTYRRYAGTPNDPNGSFPFVCGDWPDFIDISVVDCPL